MAGTMTFGERLKELRLKKRLSQEALARAAGLSVGTVRQLEQTEAEPTWATARALAKALGVPLDKLAD